jgi:succinate dehydrogenase / fumarate reductase, cytochrome b subunit
VEKASSSPPPESTFLGRHEFLLRRLHSLTGVVPIGAYLVVHLFTNATILDVDGTFQQMVNSIHSLPMLVAIEWIFIFIPLIYHALYGILLVREGLPNHSTYRYGSNIRYTLQRATGMIAFFFIFWHVFHMHGWIHAEWWETRIHGYGGMFRPYNAASSAALAVRYNAIYPVLYLIGTLSTVYHFANGLWTFGITWGLWTTPEAQARALRVCTAVGLVLSVVSLAAIYGFLTVDVDKVRERELQIIRSRIEAGEIDRFSPKMYRDAMGEEKPESAAHP